MQIHLAQAALRLLTVAVLGATAALLGPGARAQAAEPLKPSATAAVEPLVLDDELRALVPAHPRSEADGERVEALALFAAGRALERRRDYGDALRLYQRALRHDPEAAGISRAIIPLALRLRRHGQAARYALRQSQGVDSLVLRQLGVKLTEKGDWQGAVTLYEKAVAARPDKGQTARDVVLRMEMGRLYHLVEEYALAADSFARVLHALEHPGEFGLSDKIQKLLLGEAAATYNLFGECFLLSDRPEKAIEVFNKAHQIAADKGLLQYNLARVHSRRGKPAEALAALENCFAERLDSEGTAPYQLLAKVLEDLGKKDQLVERLKKLHAEDPENRPLGYFLAGRYLEANEYAKAEPLYIELVKKTPAPTGYRGLVEIYRQTGRTEALLEILGEAMEKTAILETLGEEGRTVAGDAELMRALVETARKRLETDEKSLDYGMRLAVALLAMESKQFEMAAEFFELTLAADGEKAAELLLGWGIGLLLEERPAEAAKVFQRGIDEKALPEENPLFYFYLAGALALQDRTDEALAAARKAAKTKGDSTRFLSRVAWVLYRGERYDEAIEAYKALLAKFDSNYRSSETRELLRSARLVLSNLCVIKDRLPEAEEYLEQVLDEFPDDVGASNDLGYLWADQGKHLQRSLRIIQKAVDAEPENAAYRDSLGWVLFRLGKYNEAVAELEKAAAGAGQKKDEPDAVILDHLGDAYLKAQRPQDAKRLWRRAVEAFHEEKEPEKAKTVEKKIKGQG